MKSVILGFTGASGAPYGVALLGHLLKAGCEVSLLISSAGHLVLQTETTLTPPGNTKEMAAFFREYFQAEKEQLKVYGRNDWNAPLASGSSAPKTMVICPCSVGCLSAIAVGASNNLLERAADVLIKEQGKLVLVVREMPLSVIHLEHMTALARLGVCIMPASPGFYFHPQSVEDIVNFVVGRILDQIGIPHDGPSWGGVFTPAI